MLANIVFLMATVAAPQPQQLAGATALAPRNMDDLAAAHANNMDNLAAVHADLSALVEDIKAGILVALDPAQVDPADVTDLITSHPAVPESSDAAIGAAVDDLHAGLTKLHGSGFVDPGEGRWALGLQDFIDSCLAWFAAHIEGPLGTVVDDVGEQMGEDYSFVVPGVVSMFAYLADLIGAAAIFLQGPSAGSAANGVASAVNSPMPDVMAFLKGVYEASDSCE